MKKRFLENKGNFAWRLFAIAAISVVTIYLGFFSITNKSLVHNGDIRDRSTPVEEFFQKKAVKVDDGEWNEVSNHSDLENFLGPLVKDGDSRITLSAEVLEIEIHELYFYSNADNITIKNLEDDSIIFERNASEHKRLQHYYGYGWNRFLCEPHTSIEVTVSGPNAAQDLDDFCSSLYSEDGINLLQKQLVKHSVNIILGLIILLIGLFYAFTLFLLRATKKEISPHYFSTGTLLIAGAICCLIDYHYTCLIFSEVQVVNWIDYASQLLIVVSIVDYLRSLLTSSKSQTVGSLIFGALIVCAGFSLILAAAGVFGLKECVQIAAPIAIAGIIVLIVLVLIEMRSRYWRENLLFVPFACGVSIMALFEMVHYVISGTFWVILFEIGLLVFGISQLRLLIVEANEKLLQGEKAERLRANLVQARTQVMLSQIQPHFLYNVLASIARLCDKDPKQAKAQVLTFADYMRENMDVLSQARLIPFKKELEHIRHFMALEKMRFGDDLAFKEVISFDDFYVPPLCIQAMVENAVRYGACALEEGGTVILSAIKEGNFAVVKIKDNGPGFNPKKSPEVGKTHFGIENSRKRIGAFPGAEFSIDSSHGKGCTVTIRLPIGLEEEFN
ncbi:sensor histidine kinase [Phoenicibacter congonensis]|uniref:sensor histidine kinase n=1 Tax=Phoenicibacter congonensis TaxID=1944646 RepID=UPI0009A64120|nr:histidine kinase [Phoenicibacter congonensis]